MLAVGLPTQAALCITSKLPCFPNWWAAAARIHCSRYVVVTTSRRLPPDPRLSWVRRGTYVLFVCGTCAFLMPLRGQGGPDDG